MAIDFKKVRPAADAASPIDPIAIFRSCPISDGRVNDLWLAQGDALRAYHKKRDHSDISIVLNTGAGKTLVGLLIAQSLVNESAGKVIYTCASIQLIEQTKEQAAGYGLDVTTYYRNRFSDNGYAHEKSPCLTTYQALFNGKSIFRRDDIAAVIFDDAHTADQILRDQYTLTISRDEMESVYSSLFKLFSEYQDRVGESIRYQEMYRGASMDIFWIPPNVIHSNKNEIDLILSEAVLSGNNSTKFAWEYVRDHTDHCCFLVSNHSLTITPPFIPNSTLPYFSDRVRRVYMSATLNAPDVFVRTFGRSPTTTISPPTNAGECERLVLFPSAAPNVEDVNEHKTIGTFLHEHKALIIVPTYRHARAWSEIAVPPESGSVPERVRAFRHSETDRKEKLILVGRCDGVDLPGDTCRVLVIDDLPVGSGPLERFLWGRLSINSFLGNTVASRLVQSFGRISRGMSDHGVIVITGRKLVNWLGTDRNIELLPPFLRKQIKLGLSVSKQIEDGNIEEAASLCLNRREDWIESHRMHVGDAAGVPSPPQTDVDVLRQVALAETKYMDRLWDNDFEGAAKALSKTRPMAMTLSENMGAWHGIWRAYALERSGASVAAEDLYREAHAIQRNIPRHRPHRGSAEQVSELNQVANVVSQIDVFTRGPSRPPKGLELNLNNLDSSSTQRVEESLRYLGQYLGFEASRPDKEYGKGPDVLWVVKDRSVAVCIEAKTGKKENGSYTKDDVGQLHNHMQWVREQGEFEKIYPVFVGPKNRATEAASPTSDMVVVGVEDLNRVAAKLVSALKDIANGTVAVGLQAEAESVLRSRQLLWPDVFDLLEPVPIRDIEVTPIGGP